MLPLKSITVPSNVLLFGEYVVLEEGGIGIACAVEPSLTVRCRADNHFSVVGYTATERIRYSPFVSPSTTNDSTTFLARVTDALVRQLGISMSVEPPKVRLSVDSRKSTLEGGWGSSAALTVALAAALAILFKRERFDSATIKDRLFPVAVEAHREAQGGVGSGYDIAASLYGGWGKFVGGATPRWYSHSVPWLSNVAVWHNTQPVSTPRAVARYTHWRTHNTEAHRAYLTESGRLIKELLGATEWSQAWPIVMRLVEEAQRLGGAIGVPAYTPPALVGALAHMEPRHYLCKALGAGDELFLVASSSSISEIRAPDVIKNALCIAQRGLRWSL